MFELVQLFERKAVAAAFILLNLLIGKSEDLAHILHRKPGSEAQIAQVCTNYPCLGRHTFIGFFACF